MNEPETLVPSCTNVIKVVSTIGSGDLTDAESHCRPSSTSAALGCFPIWKRLLPESGLTRAIIPPEEPSAEPTAEPTEYQHPWCFAVTRWWRTDEKTRRVRQLIPNWAFYCFCTNKNIDGCRWFFTPERGTASAGRQEVTASGSNTGCSVTTGASSSVNKLIHLNWNNLLPDRTVNLFVWTNVVQPEYGTVKA